MPQAPLQAAKRPGRRETVNRGSACRKQWLWIVLEKDREDPQRSRPDALYVMQTGNIRRGSMVKIIANPVKIEDFVAPHFHPSPPNRSNVVLQKFQLRQVIDEPLLGISLAEHEPL